MPASSPVTATFAGGWLCPPGPRGGRSGGDGSASGGRATDARPLSWRAPLPPSPRAGRAGAREKDLPWSSIGRTLGKTVSFRRAAMMPRPGDCLRRPAVEDRARLSVRSVRGGLRPIVEPFPVARAAFQAVVELLAAELFGNSPVPRTRLRCRGRIRSLSRSPRSASFSRRIEDALGRQQRARLLGGALSRRGRVGRVGFRRGRDIEHRLRQRHSPGEPKNRKRLRRVGDDRACGSASRYPPPPCARCGARCGSSPASSMRADNRARRRDQTRTDCAAR